MERADYLKVVQENPWQFSAVAGCPNPPQEWVRDAWDTKSVQESIASHMARDVSKNGEILDRPEFLEWLSAALSTEQVVRLFHLIRAWSPDRESEFRPQFEQRFARHADALPPPLTRQGVVAALVARGFDRGTAELVAYGPQPEEDIPY